MRSLQLHIISPVGELFKGAVAKVLLPGAKAPFVVLPMHAPLISSLTEGAIRYTKEGGCEQTIQIKGGFVEIKNDVVMVCTE